VFYSQGRVCACPEADILGSWHVVISAGVLKGETIVPLRHPVGHRMGMGSAVPVCLTFTRCQKDVRVLSVIRDCLWYTITNAVFPQQGETRRKSRE
jgi:hypothetical protein